MDNTKISTPIFRQYREPQQTEIGSRSSNRPKSRPSRDVTSQDSTPILHTSKAGTKLQLISKFEIYRDEVAYEVRVDKRVDDSLRPINITVTNKSNS